METISSETHLLRQQLSVSQRLVNSATQTGSLNIFMKTSGHGGSDFLNSSFGDIPTEQVPLDFVFEAGYSAEISTDNSLCPYTGSIENEEGQNLLDFSREYRNSASPKETQIKEEMKSKYPKRAQNRPRKRRVNFFIIEAWTVVKKLFIKYLNLRKTKEFIRQQYRRTHHLMTSKFKIFKNILKKLVRRTPKRKIKFCICQSVHLKDCTLHTHMCIVLRKLWKCFLNHNLEDSIQHLYNIKPLKRDILKELTILLQRKIRKSRAKSLLEKGMF